MEHARRAIDWHSTLLLWTIDESEAWYAARYPALSASELSELALLRGERRLEWWAGRYALFTLTAGAVTNWELVKDAYGKPYLPHTPHAHVSLSHTEGILVGGLVSAFPCGLDVQLATDRVGNVIERLLSGPEMAFLRAQPASERARWAHWFWCGKEALYKAYGRRSLDFRQHLALDFAEGLADASEVRAWGTVRKEQLLLRYAVHCAWQAPEGALPAYAWSTAIAVAATADTSSITPPFLL